jgi:hypothetical protein
VDVPPDVCVEEATGVLDELPVVAVGVVPDDGAVLDEPELEVEPELEPELEPPEPPLW